MILLLLLISLPKQEMQETWVLSLGQKDPLEEGMATHSSVLAWKIPMDRGAWQATVSQRVGLSTHACTITTFPVSPSGKQAQEDGSQISFYTVKLSEVNLSSFLQKMSFLNISLMACYS